jgi:hypothetical protein
LIAAAAEAPAAAIKPAPLKADREERALPASVGDVCVGGGGRFLILHLPQERKLAVFDVNEAKVVKYLAVADDHVKFAASLDKLFVALPGNNILQRWSLNTFEREVTVPLAAPGTVTTLCTGSASRGPLYVGVGGSRGARGGSALFLDPATLKAIDVKVTKGYLPGDGVFVRASADGRVFGMRNGVGGEPHTVTIIIFQGEKSAAAHQSWDVAGSVVVPSPDGQFAYSAAAVYTSQLALLHPKPPPSFAKPFLPALHGPYYMRLDYKEWDKLGGTLVFFLAGNDRPIAQLAGVAGVSNEQISSGSNRDKLTPDQRVFFIPEAKLVVSVPGSNDRLILHRFDMDRELEQSGIDYLLVTSRPVTQAVKGGAYRYALAVKSKKGGVKYRLESGPDGMRISADGRLTWDVPAGFAEAEAGVIVTVSDASGQEVFHTFKVAVRER